MICKNCKTEIISENKTRAYASLCKACHASFKRDEYQMNKNKKLTSVKRYQATERGKELTRHKANRIYVKYPEKQKARARLRYAVKIGKVSKPVYCEASTLFGCIGTSLQAHHYLGYEGEHWRDVLWLCQEHHIKAHEKEEE